VKPRGARDEISDAPVPTGEERLEPGLARVLVHHPHLQPPRAALDGLELGFEVARLDGDWRQALREWGGDPSFYTRRERSPDEIMPWDHFDVGVKKAGLLREWQRAGLGERALA